MNIASLVGQMGALGAMIWVVWHLIAKTLPENNKQMFSEIRADREAFIDEMKENRQVLRDVGKSINQVEIELKACKIKALEKNQNEVKNNGII